MCGCFSKGAEVWGQGLARLGVGRLGVGRLSEGRPGVERGVTGGEEWREVGGRTS